MIEIRNLTRVQIDENFLKRIAKSVFKNEVYSEAKRSVKNEGVKKLELSIALVGCSRMKKLNKIYRHKNRITDVLAFGENPCLAGRQEKLDELGFGEIAICLREVRKNAKRYGTTFKKELIRVLIHGILHLLGFNHQSLKEAKKMKQKEEYYFSAGYV